jgi:L-lactate utilization protein LutC
LPKCHHAALISYQIVWFVLNNIKTQEYLIWNIKQKIERSTNQKINLIERSTWLKDSTDRKINRSINRSKDQLIERSADHKINRLKDQPIKIDWKIKYMNTKKTKLNKLKDQLNKRSTDQKINRSKDQPIERSTDRKINWSNDQPIERSTDRKINQSK